MLSRISAALCLGAGYFAGRGEYAADLLPAVNQTHRPRLRSFCEKRRDESYRLVQGPRHDGGCVESA